MRLDGADMRDALAIDADDGGIDARASGAILSVGAVRLHEGAMEAPRTHASSFARREKQPFARGHAALAPYDTPGAMLGAMARGSAMTVTERDQVFAAIVSELQSSSHLFWQSLLMVACTPMLVRIRVSLRCPKSDELDQRVAIAFIETARALRHRGYVARNLRLLTRARIFADLSRERRGADTLSFDEETHPYDPFEIEAHQRASAAELLRMIESEHGAELRDVLLSGAYDGDSIRAYVERAYADCDERVRARTAKRLHRARRDALAKLRTRAARRGLVRARAA
jgi:hypothetical protein